MMTDGERMKKKRELVENDLDTLQSNYDPASRKQRPKLGKQKSGIYGGDKSPGKLKLSK